MALSLVASYFVKTTAQGTGVLTTPSFTPSNGEIVVVKCETWDTTISMGTPTGGSQTYTNRVAYAPGGFRPWCGIWTATISGSPGSMTISSGSPSASARYSMTVERWSGAQLAATPATGTNNDSTGAANGALTAGASGSVVSWVAADSQSVDPATRAYLGSGTDEGVRDDHVGSNGVGYHGYQSVASAGSVTFGLSAPTGMKYSIAGIEIQAAAGGSAVNVSDTTSTGLRLRPASETVVFGVSANDSGLRAALRSAPEAVAYGISASDAPGLLTLRSADGPGVTFGVSASDSPGALALRSADGAGVAYGVAALDSISTGARLGATLANVSAGVVASDTPGALRWLSVAPSGVVIGSPSAVTVADVPGALRFGFSGAAVTSVSAPTTRPILAPVRRALVSAPLGGVIIATVKEDRP